MRCGVAIIGRRRFGEDLSGMDVRRWDGKDGRVLDGDEVKPWGERAES